MPYVTLGTTDQLQIKVPTNGSTNWGNVMKSDTFQKIAEHDHSGSGKGQQLGSGSLLDNAVIGSKIRLNNDEYLRARNFALDADVNILKLNTSDKLEITTDIAEMSLTNNTYLKARNAADDGYVNILKVNAQDRAELSIGELVASGSATLLDDTDTPTDASIVTILQSESAEIFGNISRGFDSRAFRITLHGKEDTIVESYTGEDDIGVDFDIDNGVLKYTLTGTGDNATVKYLVIRG